MASMTLKEIISFVRGSILDDISGEWETDDSDLLWSNAELTLFANDGEREVCERNPISDSLTASICQVPIIALTANYVIDPRIISIDAIWLSSHGNAIRKVDVPFLDANYDNWRGKQTEDDVHSYIIDRDTKNFRLVFIPTVSDTANLEVTRRPITEMKWSKRKTDKPEIGERYHISLAYWIAYRAYLKQDTDALDTKASDRYYSLFEKEVGIRVDASRDDFRKWVSGRRPRTRSYFK